MGIVGVISEKSEQQKRFEIMHESFKNRLFKKELEESFNENIDLFNLDEQSNPCRGTIRAKSLNFEIEIDFNQNVPDKWKMKLLERMIMAYSASLCDMIQNFEKLEYFSPDIKTWYGDHGCIEDIEYITLDFLEKEGKYSQYCYMISNILDILPKLKGNKVDYSKFGKMSLRENIQGYYTQEGKDDLRFSFCLDTNTSDWRAFLFAELLPSIIYQLQNRILKLDTSYKFIDEKFKEEPNNHIEEIIDCYISKKLKRDFEFIRKSIFNFYYKALICE